MTYRGGSLAAPIPIGQGAKNATKKTSRAGEKETRNPFPYKTVKFISASKVGVIFDELGLAQTLRTEPLSASGRTTASESQSIHADDLEATSRSSTSFRNVLALYIAIRHLLQFVLRRRLGSWGPLVVKTQSAAHRASAYILRRKQIWEELNSGKTLPTIPPVGGQTFPTQKATSHQDRPVKVANAKSAFATHTAEASARPNHIVDKFVKFVA